MDLLLRTTCSLKPKYPYLTPQVPANLLLVKNMTMHGIFWGSYLQRQPQVLLEGMAQVLQWMTEGKLSVQVGCIPVPVMVEALQIGRCCNWSV